MGVVSARHMGANSDEARKIFSAIDLDGSGTIDVSEVRNALEAYGRPADRSTVVDIICNADDDGSGTVDFTGFMASMLEQEGNSEAPLIALYQAMKNKLCSPIMQDLGRVKGEMGGRDLTAWLAEAGAEAYESAIRNDLGVTELADLQFIQASDLNDIGLTGSEQRRFLEAAKSASAWAFLQD